MKFVTCPCGKEFVLSWSGEVRTVDVNDVAVHVCSEECQTNFLALVWAKPRGIQ